MLVPPLLVAFFTVKLADADETHVPVTLSSALTTIAWVPSATAVVFHPVSHGAE